MTKTRARIRRRAFRPSSERVEERVMPGFVGIPASLAALVGQFAPVKDLDGAGLSRLLSALRGGAGQEFRMLLQRQVKNPSAIVLQFLTGQRTSFETRGFAVRTPKLLASYTGPQLDQFNPMATGAVVLPKGMISLAAIMRGPIDRPEPVRYVWAFDTGRGSINPFPEAPNVKADTLVTVERMGKSSMRLFVTDLVANTTRELGAKRVLIDGPTIRLRINPATEMPGGAQPIGQATFTFWTQSSDGGIETVGRFLPDHNIALGRLPPR